MIDHLRYGLHRQRHPVRYAHYDRLLHTQAMTRDALRVKQQRDLADIVAFAASHTAYYRETLSPFLSHGNFKLGDLPILHKHAVAQRLDDLLARRPHPNLADRSAVKIGHTGGSTGKPLAFYYDNTKHELMRAGMMRSYRLSGWRTGQKILNFWGARQDVLPGGVFSAHVGDFIAAEHTLAAFDYTEAQLVEWARFIQRYRPVLLQGYASVLSEVARAVIEHRLAMPKTLRGVYSTAEILTDRQRQQMRQAFGCKVFNQYGSREIPNIACECRLGKMHVQMRQAFGCKVFNQYGSREIPNIACECRLGKMHVFTDMVMLESVPQINNSGENENRLLVTSLTNRPMPMILYDLGDTGRLLDGGCECGLPFPLMEMELCRQNDLIRTQTGKTVHPSYFNRLLYGQTQIKQYQWVQLDVDRMRLNLVAPQRLGEEQHHALRRTLQQDVDTQMRLEIHYLDAIPHTLSGKHRVVVGLPQSLHPQSGIRAS